MANLKLLFFLFFFHGSFPSVKAVVLHFTAGRQYLALGLAQNLLPDCIFVTF